MAKKQQVGVTDVKEIVKAAASGRMVEVLHHVAGIPADCLDGKNGPCPKCGGTDRFRLVDDEEGAVLCNQCFNKQNGDFISAIQWFRGVDFLTALNSAAAYLGVTTTAANGQQNYTVKVVPRPWNELLAASWCLTKPPITVDAVKAWGGTIADYGSAVVMAFPIMGADLSHANPVGWVCYNITGGTLPKKNKDGTYEQVKVKIAGDSDSGILGNPESFVAASTVIKAEGCTDGLAWQSSGLPEGTAVFTNSAGCGQWPMAWLIQGVRGKDVLIVHDADKPGQEGATGKWGPQLAQHSNNCRNVSLPYPIEETHGKDSRDFLNGGGTFDQLLLLPFFSFTRASVTAVSEGPTDPHRLARINLQRYAEVEEGGTCRLWNDQHYTWKRARGCWKHIEQGELRAKVSASIKNEFNRMFIEQKQNGEKVEHCHQVTQSLVSNVIAAMNSQILLPYHVPLQRWIEDKHNGGPQARNLISMENGILDLDALARNEDNVLFPHSPKWFSLTRLPYPFIPDARSDEWEDYMWEAQEHDLERVMVAQEWGGYAITPTTDLQKFMCLEGDGRNGKSVFMAGLAAIVGMDNCSFLGLEDFSDSFAAHSTVGKLLNISADCPYLENVAEGVIKKFASGDPISFNRKGLPRVSAIPTARLVISFNLRPRFTDKSTAIWRRMILLPFKRKIRDDEVILGMDKADYWIRNGHAPGMLNWALRGWLRLKQQGHFTKSAVVKGAIEDYQRESNAARSFLIDCVEAREDGRIQTKELYTHYRRWCEADGYTPVNEVHFGQEVARTFPTAKKGRPASVNGRMYVYEGLKYAVDEIAGKKVEQGFF